MAETQDHNTEWEWECHKIIYNVSPSLYILKLAKGEMYCLVSRKYRKSLKTEELKWVTDI